jgi:ornithine carrier protein
MAWFGAYESMCRFLLHRRSLHPDRKDQLSALELMVAGGTAGMAYHITFFPADVIKSVYQTQPAVPTSSSSSVADGSGTGQQLKWRDVVRSVVRRDGIRGFYQGLGITLLRAFPSNAVVFLCYENLSRYWKTVHG